MYLSRSETWRGCPGLVSWIQDTCSIQDTSRGGAAPTTTARTQRHQVSTERSVVYTGYKVLPVVASNQPRRTNV